MSGSPLSSGRIGSAVCSGRRRTSSSTTVPLVQPDLFVTPLVEGRHPRTWQEVRALLLALEVLSPSSARADRQIKRRRYQRYGVPDYWIVDLDARLVERWRPADERPEILAERLEWQPATGLSPLPIDLPQLFAEILDE